MSRAQGLWTFYPFPDDYLQLVNGILTSYCCLGLKTDLLIQCNVIFMIAQVLKNKEADDKQSKDDSEPVDTASKRDDAVYQGQIYIEAMLTADKTTCDFYGNRTLDYLLNTANLVIVAVCY